MSRLKCKLPLARPNLSLFDLLRCSATQGALEHEILWLDVLSPSAAAPVSLTSRRRYCKILKRVQALGHMTPALNLETCPMICGKKHNALDTVHGSIAMPALNGKSGSCGSWDVCNGRCPVLGAGAWDICVRALIQGALLS